MQLEKRFQIGLTAVDDEHAELLSAIESYQRSQKWWASGTVLMQDFRRIERLIVLHFRDEERYMRNIQFPGYLEHKKEHRRIINEIRQLKRELKGLTREQAWNAYLQFLKSWIITHLVQFDLRINEYIEGELMAEA
ncbi:MAG: bacteriohemerythrin [Magnetovibrionaceae bacterium]